MSEYGYDADQPGGVEQQSAPEDTTEYTVIIDIGESTTKVGLAGDDPVIFPTIVGKPKYKNLMQDVAGVVKGCGNDAIICGCYEDRISDFKSACQLKISQF